MEETWDGDEEEAELPIVGGEPRPSRRRRAMATPRPKGVPASAVPDVRRQVLASATGRDHPEPEAWREEMDNGRRDRAASALESGGRRGTGSGFGLA